MCPEQRRTASAAAARQGAPRVFRGHASTGAGSPAHAQASWLIDTVGAKDARIEIAAIKVAVPRAAAWVLDKAIQLYGGAGVSDDVPLAEMWAQVRTLRLADGPDEVHLRSIARAELAAHLD